MRKDITKFFVYYFVIFHHIFDLYLSVNCISASALYFSQIHFVGLHDFRIDTRDSVSYDHCCIQDLSIAGDCICIQAGSRGLSLLKAALNYIQRNDRSFCDRKLPSPSMSEMNFAYLMSDHSRGRCQFFMAFAVEMDFSVAVCGIRINNCRRPSKRITFRFEVGEICVKLKQ